MSTTLSLETNHSIADTKPILVEALSDQLSFVRMRFLKYDRECKEFESKYQMDSDSFFRKFESGELGDELHWFDWYASLKGRQIWNKKLEVLSEIR